MASTRIKKPSNPKIFIDSSVLIAAAISPKGSAREIINQGFAKSLDLYISDVVLEETERNLKLKAPHTLEDFYNFKETFVSKIVAPPRQLILKVAEVVNIKDAPIVAAAMQAKADGLASYDRKHLLQHKEEIEKNFKVKVGTPDEFLKSRRV